MAICSDIRCYVVPNLKLIRRNLSDYISSAYFKMIELSAVALAMLMFIPRSYKYAMGLTVLLSGLICSFGKKKTSLSRSLMFFELGRIASLSHAAFDIYRGTLSFGNGLLLFLLFQKVNNSYFIK
jgi:hypothetical protein